MGIIKYDEKTILDARNNIDIYNSNIQEALEKINNELLTMESTLSTPKSTKAISMYVDYFDNRIKFVSNSKEMYHQMITNVNNDYTEYLNDIKEMVG